MGFGPSPLCMVPKSLSDTLLLPTVALLTEHRDDA